MRTLAQFLTAHDRAIRVALTRVRGSSPREAGTAMLVAEGGLHGTIGGGQLEYLAIDRARQMLRRDEALADMDVPLGPEIGQCCGGRVELSLTLLDAAGRTAEEAREATERAALPEVQIHGAGHVGRALAGLMAQMPVRCVLIDSRADELALTDAPVEKRLSPLPEAEIDRAPAGSAFVVMTHDHALDFLVASAALARGDAAYAGLIGSATKRAKFAHWARDHAGQRIDALTCPIGAQGSRDKRPAVIAAFVAAEIMAALTQDQKTEAGAETAPRFAA